MSKLSKGYAEDAGYDVLLDEDVCLKPGINIINLNLQIKVKENQLAYLQSRTSSAKNGIIVAQCPIDPNYNGDVHAIVYNITNNYIHYTKGQAFCQLVYLKCGDCLEDYEVRKEGKRIDGRFGSTGG